ncbi:hypothetical protein GCM10010309_77170 [Streptomyces violaceochromogenes]|nr:hypothetical protein GCM10010309_77170 [Streptomyces violaceochromogenes]
MLWRVFLPVRSAVRGARHAAKLARFGGPAGGATVPLLSAGKRQLSAGPPRRHPMADAIALAAALREHTERAELPRVLARYERERKAAPLQAYLTP